MQMQEMSEEVKQVSNFRLCNRLHNIGNPLPAVNKRFNSNFKTCNRLPKEIFRKLFLRVTSFQMVFR